MIQRSLVLMKPDAVKRGIVGEILHRFERMGLKIVGAKMLNVSKDFGSKHYNHNDAWKLSAGERTLKDAIEAGFDPITLFGTSEPMEVGKIVDEWNAEFLASGPVFALVFEGPNAVQRIRDHVGKTFSSISPAGTIRGDFGLDSGLSGMKRKRTSYNMVHASGTPSEAESEIELWFKKEEILSYRRIHEDLYSY